METKSILKSKTIWFNTLMLLVSGLAYVKPEYLTMLGVSPVNQTEILTVAGAITSVVNLLLRKATTSAVTMPVLAKSVDNTPAV